MYNKKLKFIIKKDIEPRDVFILIYMIISEYDNEKIDKVFKELLDKR